MEQDIGGEAFECMAYDAHCPSMTMRFKVPEGIALAGGIYRIERVRSATDEDKALFSKYPDPIDAFELVDALQECRDQFAFYAAEHRKAGKYDKAATNERFASLATQALKQAGVV